MPTEFLTQNGIVIHQDTPVEVEGCPRTLAVIAHRVRGRTLTLTVYAPGAGRLKATARGLSTAGRSTSKSGAVTLTLKERKAGRLRTRVVLSFTPQSAGKTRSRKQKTQTKTLAVRFK
jgi:hypothetical protein